MGPEARFLEALLEPEEELDWEEEPEDDCIAICIHADG
jgi:hypothetical protein